MNILMMMVVLAEAAADPGLWVSIVDLAVQILTPILLVLASWVAVKLAKKFNLEALLADGELAKDAVHAGIGYAERWAKQRGVGNAFGADATGSQKLVKAIEYIAKVEGKLGLGEKAADAISRRIHSELGLTDLANEAAAAGAINLDGVLGLPPNQPES